MKKLLILSGVCAMAALVSQTAQAEVKVRAGVASSSYELGGDYITAKSDYKPTNFGLTLASDSGLYLDLAVSSGTGKHDGWTNSGAPAEDFKRTDSALIVGSSTITESGNASTFYVGIKTGSTTLSAKNNPFVLWNEETFDSAGFVFGGGAAFPIASGSGGSIGVNAGLGVMGATWKDDTGFNVKAKTAVGVSFGVNYTFPFTSNFGVVADYKYNSYSYDFGDTATPFKVNEKISAIGASLYAKF